ncbi:MAG: FkbM family methyltransferase [Arcicella sp.]|nr:FkbM family methyltransferase [Arcicella sp.]
MKLKTIKTVINHPLNEGRKLKALINLFLRAIVIRLHKYPIIYPFVNDTFLVVEKGMSSAELQIYCNLYDYDEMLLMIHFLRENDNFVDVGANIGVYSILASGVGKANSFSFEPLPSTFNRLKRNINYNYLSDKVTLFNNGVGDKKEQLFFTNNLDAINHVVSNSEGNTLRVEVDTLDAFLGGKSAHFLKVDVEGFEEFVLRGAANTLKNPDLCIILIETNGLTSQYNSSDEGIHEKLTQSGFLTYTYHPQKRELIKTESLNATNTIYCRNIDFIKSRIKNGQKITILDKEY